MKENNLNDGVELRVDKDYRIFLPTFFDVSYQDKVVILTKEDYIEVWDFITFYEYIEQLKSIGDVENVVKYVYDNNVFVSTKKRFCLTSDLVSRYEIKDSVIIKNCGNHICIFNKENYEFLCKILSNVNQFECLCSNKTADCNFNLSVNLWRNRVYVTSLLRKSNISSSKVILVPKKNFIEVYDYFEYVALVEEARKKFEQEPIAKNKKCLDSLLFVLKNRCCDIITNCKGNKYFYLPYPLIEFYDFNVSLCLESQNGYFRIWEPTKFEAYQKQKKEEEVRKLFIRKVQERKLKRNNH